MAKKQDKTSMPADEVATLVEWRESAEEASYNARKEAERDRDYHDNKQLTAAEIKTLKARRQPVVIKNRIKRKIDYLCGLEKRQRANPKATPRTPVEEQNAFAATDSIRYVVDDQDYAAKRSQVWRNICVEGAGGFSVGVEVKKGQPVVTIRRTHWDRMFWDPHSSEADFSDAMYKGIDTWMDESEALSRYGDTPENRAILSATYQLDSTAANTYDDKPKAIVWSDSTRKRVRVTQMYFRPRGIWHYAEFTRGGLLKGGVSPYLDEDGEPDCEFEFQSAYVDRDNNRYGVVREMIGAQDEINKRSSKALHLLTVRQVRVSPSAGLEVEKTRKEMARADGVVEAEKDQFEVLPTGDLASGQFQLLQEAKTEIDLMGANSALLGEQGGAPSGKAIQLNQTGGLIELGDLMDGLRHLDVRVFRAVWNRIRQFWTEEKWIKTTDDERNIRFVGLNVGASTKIDLMRMYPDGLPENMNVLERPIGELDVDITIDAVPDSIMPQQEQFNGLVELLKAGVPLPPQMLIESMPNLRNREQALRMLEQQQQQPNPEAQRAEIELTLEQQRAMAELQRKREESAIDAERKERDALLQARINMDRHAQEMMFSREKHEQEMQQDRERAELQAAVTIAKTAKQNRIAERGADSRAGE